MEGMNSLLRTDFCRSDKTIIPVLEHTNELMAHPKKTDSDDAQQGILHLRPIQ